MRYVDADMVGFTHPTRNGCAPLRDTLPREDDVVCSGFDFHELYGLRAIIVQA